jgi:hypothetical protein
MNSVGKIVLVGLEYGKYFVVYTEGHCLTLESLELDYENIWFRAFTPLEIIEIHEKIEKEALDTYTIQYMEKYGIGNVRSHEYLSQTISLGKDIYISILKKMLGSEWSKIYSQIHNRMDSEKKMYSVDEKYKDHEFLDVDFYNKTKRCESCFCKENHAPKCIYIHIRPLPHIDNAKIV